MIYTRNLGWFLRDGHEIRYQWFPGSIGSNEVQLLFYILFSHLPRSPKKHQNNIYIYSTNPQDDRNVMKSKIQSQNSDYLRNHVYKSIFFEGSQIIPHPDPSARHSRANRTVALVDTKCAADFGSITTTERGDRMSRTPGAKNHGPFVNQRRFVADRFRLLWTQNKLGFLGIGGRENLKRKPWFLPLCSCIP